MDLTFNPVIGGHPQPPKQQQCEAREMTYEQRLEEDHRNVLKYVEFQNHMFINSIHHYLVQQDAFS